MECWGWRKEALCQDISLLGVTQSLNIFFKEGLTGVEEESTDWVSKTELLCVALPVYSITGVHSMERHQQPPQEKPKVDQSWGTPMSGDL